MILYLTQRIELNISAAQEYEHRTTNQIKNIFFLTLQALPWILDDCIYRIGRCRYSKIMKGDSLDICENDEKNMHVLSEWVLICYYEVIESYFGYCCWDYRNVHSRRPSGIINHTLFYQWQWLRYGAMKANSTARPVEGIKSERLRSCRGSSLHCPFFERHF